MTVHLIVQLLVLVSETKDAEELTRRLEDLLDAYGFDFYRLTLRPAVRSMEKEVVLAQKRTASHAHAADDPGCCAAWHE